MASLDSDLHDFHLDSSIPVALMASRASQEANECCSLRRRQKYCDSFNRCTDFLLGLLCLVENLAILLIDPTEVPVLRPISAIYF